MKIFSKMMPMLFALLLFIGCSKESGQESVPDGPVPEDGKTELTIGLAIPKLAGTPLPASGTGVTEDPESVVNDLWVLQFDNTGKLLLSECYDNFTPVSSTHKKVSVALFKSASASTVYFVANVGKEYFKSLGSVTLADFEAQTFDFSKWAGTMPTSGLPMVGVYTGPTEQSPSEPIKLTRLVSRVEFTCTVALTSQDVIFDGGKILPADKLTLNRVQITNAASKVQYKAHALTQSGDLMVCDTPYPANATNADLADNYMSYAEDTSVAGQTTFTFVWYLPENLKGAVAGLTETTKGPDKAPAGSTCIEISGDYTTATYVGDKTEPDYTIKDVTYCIYPGQNATTDFNLIRNYSYKISTEINGIDKADTRVVVEKGIPAGEYTDGVWPEDAPAGE